VKTQRALIDGMINQEVTFARLCTAFALLALAIACVGLYGTTSYGVSRRTSEIGLRMALGTSRGTVLRLVLTSTMTLAVAGVAVGLLMAPAAGRLLSTLLYGVTPTDGISLAIAPAVLILVVILGCLGPAWSAVRTDPTSSLRDH